MCACARVRVIDFSWTSGPRILKFGSNIGYDLYCVREMDWCHLEYTFPTGHFVYWARLFCLKISHWMVNCIQAVWFGATQPGRFLSRYLGFIYHIQPNYRTVHLSFSNLLGQLWLNMYPPILSVHFKKISERLIKWCLCNVSVFVFFSWFSLKKHMLWIFIWIALAVIWRLWHC